MVQWPSKMKAKKLERIFIVLPRMELETHLTGDKGVPKKPGLIRVRKSFTMKYNIEGWKHKIDIADPTIENVINQ